MQHRTQCTQQWYFHGYAKVKNENMLLYARLMLVEGRNHIIVKQIELRLMIVKKTMSIRNCPLLILFCAMLG